MLVRKLLRKILVNFKWCFPCQLIASTARQDGFCDTLPVRTGRHWTTNDNAFPRQTERCNPWPHVSNCHVSIRQFLPLWRHHARSPGAHYDVMLVVTSFVTRPSHGRYRQIVPASRYDVILIMTSLAPLQTLRTYVCMYEQRNEHTDTLPRLVYRDLRSDGLCDTWGVLTTV